MSGYYFINVDIVMRDCFNAQDAVKNLVRLMPRHPDHTTTFMESWSVESVSTCEKTEYDRMSHSREYDLDLLVNAAEKDAQ